MAAELITPTDELTGMPLPIAPIDSPYKSDWHHHFHPKLSPLLQNDIGGKAVRAARIQKVDYPTHHNDYHGIYLGPPLPETDEDKFAMTIMSAAGYMPDSAIKFNKRQPEIIKLDPQLQRRMQTSGEIKVGGSGSVGAFIRQYVMQQPIESINVNELTIEEFLETKDNERRLEIGHALLGLITKKATEPVAEVYYQAFKKDKLLPGVPGNVRRFTKAKLGHKKMRDRLIIDLHGQLAA